MNTNGNIWKKWDLHLHTPVSLFNNQYGINIDNQDSIWDKFVSMIEKADIQVIGATDYYSLDGYEKLQEYKNQGRLSNVLAIFPNIEVRLNVPLQNTRFVNYHIIFSPDISVDKIKKSFLEKLSFRMGDKKYNFNKNDLL